MSQTDSEASTRFLFYYDNQSQSVSTNSENILGEILSFMNGKHFFFAQPAEALLNFSICNFYSLTKFKDDQLIALKLELLTIDERLGILSKQTGKLVFFCVEGRCD